MSEFRSYNISNPTMSLNALITFLLVVWSANAASTINMNTSTPQTSKIPPSTAFPSLLPCQECKGGYQTSTCTEMVQHGNSDSATDQPMELITMKSAGACLLLTTGKHRGRITSACICNDVRNATDNLGQPADEGMSKGADILTLIVFVGVPCFVLLLCFMCRKFNPTRVPTTVRPQQDETDCNDAHKQREYVLAILFPSSGEKVGTVQSSAFSSSL